MYNYVYMMEKELSRPTESITYNIQSIDLRQEHHQKDVQIFVVCCGKSDVYLCCKITKTIYHFVISSYQ